MTESPTWTRGYALPFLKEVAALFRAEFKPHTYGAFGIPKERDVADAMAEGALLWTRAQLGNGPLEGAAVARFVQRPQPHSDFAGRRAAMQPGDVFVKSIAGTWGGKCRILDSLARRKPPALWIEAHVENAETASWLSAAGFSLALTKVAAASDLKGLYMLGADFGRLPPERLDAADVPGVKILRPEFLSAQEAAEILAEIFSFGADAFAQHYSSYNKRQSWTAFAIRGYVAGDPGFIIKPAEMSKAWKAENPALLGAECGWTSAIDRFPATRRLLKRLPVAKMQRVRFMRLGAAGGELTRHADITDPEAGTRDDQVARLHIPIRTNPACVFRSWDLEGVEHRLHMPERDLCYIDTRKPHAVINPAEVERIHLVVDAYGTPELRKLIAG